MLEHEHIYLDALPSAQMYERSYMHRDVVTHVLTAQEQDFIITGSADGHLKFWKKKGEGIEFAKHFRAHMEAVAGLFCYVARLPGVPAGPLAGHRPPGRCLKSAHQGLGEPEAVTGLLEECFPCWQASWLLT